MPLPLGEEIWVRRDCESRGGPFLFREASIALYTILIMILPVIFTALSTVLLRKAGIGYAIILMMLAPSLLLFYFLSFPAFKVWMNLIACSCRCPLWLHAEQLNPERLAINHIYRIPTIIELADSTVDTINLRWFTTVKVQDTHTTATLGLLTHEEYDRFMQYWNAAQKTHDE